MSNWEPVLRQEIKALKSELTTAESAVADLMELNDKLTSEVKVYDNNFCVMEQLFIESQEEVEALKVDVVEWETTAFAMLNLPYEEGKKLLQETAEQALNHKEG